MPATLSEHATRIAPGIAIKNILVATDFSATAQKALQVAIAIAKRHGASVVIAHVVAPEAYTLTPPDSLATVYQISMRTAREQFSRFENAQVFGTVPHKEVIREGIVGEELAKIIEERHIDLVVVGTHGATGVEKLVLGSTAEEIFRLSPKPVLTVGPHVSDDVEFDAALDRILFPTDLSPQSVRALPYAMSLMHDTDSVLTVLYVEDKLADDTAESRRVLQKVLTGDLERMVGHLHRTVPLVYDVEFGNPVENILNVASKQRANLIVLGVQRQRDLASHATWSVASKVVRGARCPVLTVRDSV